jgi:hypothetical protein
MKKHHVSILIFVLSLVAILIFIQGQREHSTDPVATSNPKQLSKKDNPEPIVRSDSNKIVDDESDQRKQDFLARKQQGLTAAQEFSKKSTPASIRSAMSKGSKYREKRYLDLMDSLDISRADADQIFKIILERNIQCYTISIRANAEGDDILKEYLRSGQAPIKNQARLDMIKIVGETNADKIAQLEKQFVDEILGSAMDRD